MPRHLRARAKSAHAHLFFSTVRQLGSSPTLSVLFPVHPCLAGRNFLVLILSSCCVEDGAWSPWSRSSHPSSCSGGSCNFVQIKTRTCTNPPPTGRGRPCQGFSLTKRYCDRSDVCKGKGLVPNLHSSASLYSLVEQKQRRLAIVSEFGLSFTMKSVTWSPCCYDVTKAALRSLKSADLRQTQKKKNGAKS